MRETLTPEWALALLQAGNERFAGEKPEHADRSLGHLRAAARAGQHPVATVVGCSDSRCPVELLFDAGVGDIFVVRVAGNVCDVDEIGSIEYGVVHLGTPLTVVLGHTQCGAVTAAVEGAVTEGSIPRMLEQIEPAVRKTRGEHPDAAPRELIDLAAVNNVWQAIENLFRGSPLVAVRVREGTTKVVGAFLELETGRIEWLGEHPQQAALMMH